MILVNGDEVQVNSVFASQDLARFLMQFKEDERQGQFAKLIDSALVVRSAFLLDLETTTIANSVKLGKEALDEHFTSITDEIRRKMNELTDPDEGQFSKTFGDVVDRELNSILDPHNPSSKVGQLKDAIFQEINGLETKVSTIQSKLGILVNQSKSTDDGNIFENLVGSHFGEFAAMFQDTFTRTGYNPSLGTSQKKGDVYISIQDEEPHDEGKSIAIEMKTAEKFKRVGSPGSPRTAHEVEIQKEMTKAMQTRKADVGIFVLDSHMLNMEIQPKWQLLSRNSLLIVLDTINPESEYIQLAYAWARWQLMKQSDKHAESPAPVDSSIKTFIVEEKLNEILDLVKSAKSVSDAFGRLQTAVGAAQSAVKSHRDEIETKIRIFISEVAMI
jgi:hypothetical protein